MVTLASCAPQSLVVTTTTISTTVTSTPATTTTTTTTTTQSPTSTTTEKLMATEPLEMTKFHIKSEIQFRYARTVVESTVTNPDTVAQLASFALVIPDSAFISAFSMEIGGEEYNARVEEKEEAEKTFEKALNRGRGAGLVSPRERSLLLAALWGSQLRRIQCLVEARGRLQGDRQFWERAFPGGFLSEEGAMLNTPDGAENL